MPKKSNGSQPIENMPDTDPASEVIEAEAELRRAIEQERRRLFDTLPLPE